ncbi:hypothetical protein GJ496_008081 [Pomphorhynchus laevis]|nr:hypothetical protein GJ496_008081 [Pomphorhynchus laevis]
MDYLKGWLTSSSSKNINDYISYTNITTIAALCVYEGCKRSVVYLKKRKSDEDKAQVLSTREVAVFPLMASATLLTAYIIFRLFSKEYTNILLNIYFLIVGVAALFRAFRSVFLRLIPNLSPLLPNTEYVLSLTAISTESTSDKDQQKGKPEEIDKWRFNAKDLLIIAVFTSFAVWNYLNKHWLANNLIAIAISINAIEILQLNKFSNGVILLSGLFLYDIFWVFGTNVMVSVAKNIEGPIKIVWPNNTFNSTVWKGQVKGTAFAMLGLGDIVIPGIFIALLKRFDDSRTDGTGSDINDNKSSPHLISYYQICFAFYLLALVCTILVMLVFKHAQPALLYIVPLLVLPVTLLALVRGDLTKLIAYRDEAEDEDSCLKADEHKPKSD